MRLHKYYTNSKLILCMFVFSFSSTAHRSDKRSFALNIAHLKGVQAPIGLVLDHTLGVMNFMIPDSSDSTHDSGTQYF